jgi:hypothetical protein
MLQWSIWKSELFFSGRVTSYECPFAFARAPVQFARNAEPRITPVSVGTEIVYSQLMTAWQNYLTILFIYLV